MAAAPEPGQSLYPSPLAVSVTEGTDVTLLNLSTNFEYVPPSCAVFTASIRQCEVQIDTPGGVKIFDAFIQSDPSLPQRRSNVPQSIKIKKFCFIPIEEFSKVIYVKHLRALRDGLLLIWRWKGTSEQDDEGPSTPDIHIEGTDSNETADVSSEGECEESMVPFKCVGVLRDQRIQTILREIRDRRESGEEVQVRLKQEPENPYDSNAVRFEADHGHGWQRIGYVAKELCSDVNAAINSGQIKQVEFGWVKYKVWKKSPGFYTAINITRKGEWSTLVKRQCSSFF